MKISCNFLKREFSTKSISMRHDNLADFFKSQWQKSDKISIPYMFYRLLIALIFAVTLILSIVDLNDVHKSAEKRAKWLIYLTHWGYIVCAIQSSLAFCMVFYAHKKKYISKGCTSEPDINSNLCAVYWALFIIAVDAAFAITCIYWTLIFDPKKHQLDVMNIFVHGLNSVIMMIDLFIVAHPVRLLHCYWPFMFAVVYIVFNVIYYLLGGTDKDGLNYIYTILDWEKPSRSVLVTFLSLVFLVFLHAVVYCLFLIRRSLHRTCAKSSGEFSLSVIDTKKHMLKGKRYENDRVEMEYI